MAIQNVVKLYFDKLLPFKMLYLVKGPFHFDSKAVCWEYMASIYHA